MGKTYIISKNLEKIMYQFLNFADSLLILKSIKLKKIILNNIKLIFQMFPQ